MKTTAKIKCLALICTACVFAHQAAYAQNITQTTGISFGSFAITNNNAVHTLSFTWTETVTADPEFIVIINPSRGEYAITGFPASSPLSVSIQNADMTKDGLGVGEHFFITTYDHNAITTDGSGAATLYIGADLDTSGSMSMYADGNYTDTIDITVSFP